MDHFPVQASAILAMGKASATFTGDGAITPASLSALTATITAANEYKFTSTGICGFSDEHRPDRILPFSREPESVTI